MTTSTMLLNFDSIDPRTKDVSPALVAAILDRIVDKLQPQRVILFGSRASDEAQEDSDIDLLVILDDDHPLSTLKPSERFQELQRLFRHRYFGLDAILLTYAEVQVIQRTNEGEWDLILEILAEGKLLYGRAEPAKAKRTHSTADPSMVSQSST